MLRYAVGDTDPDFTLFLERDREPVKNLDLAERVDFKLYKPSGAIVTVQLAVVSAEKGQVQGAWSSSSDLDESGQMYGDVVITWSAGQTEHPIAPVRVLVRAEGEVE